MRFISKYPGFRLTLIHDKYDYPSVGAPILREAGFVAEFSPDASEWEIAAARELVRQGRWKFQGTVSDLDETPIDPILSTWGTRVSSFDTASIEDATRRKQVEALMLEASGRPGAEFVLVDKPKPKAPWPKYTALRSQGQRTPAKVAEQVAAQVRELGLDPEDVIAFERENPRKESEAVIAAMEKLAAEPSEDEPDAVVA